MTANQIRDKYETLRGGFDNVVVESGKKATLTEALGVFQVELLVEIAAQLAELNKNLHPY